MSFRALLAPFSASHILLLSLWLLLSLRLQPFEFLLLNFALLLLPPEPCAAAPPELCAALCFILFSSTATSASRSSSLIGHVGGGLFGGGGALSFLDGVAPLFGG